MYFPAKSRSRLSEVCDVSIAIRTVWLPLEAVFLKKRRLEFRRVASLSDSALEHFHQLFDAAWTDE